MSVQLLWLTNRDFSKIQRIITHESLSIGEKTSNNGYVWTLLREQNHMCKVKISRLEYLGGQAGPCWQPQPWERKNKYNYQFQTTTWKRMRLLSFDSFFCLIFFLFLSSSFLFSDSSHLCFSICPYCRKFDSETSLDYTFAYMYWTVLIFIFRINDPGMSTQLRRIIGWTEQCDWYLWLLGSAVLLFIFLIIIWVFHILPGTTVGFRGTQLGSWGKSVHRFGDML